MMRENKTKFSQVSMKILIYVIIFTLIIPGSMVFGAELNNKFYDDFEQYAANSYIPSYQAVTDCDGALIPLEGYNWASRYQYGDESSEDCSASGGFYACDYDGNMVGRLYHFDGDTAYGVSSIHTIGCSSKRVVLKARIKMNTVGSGIFSIGLCPKVPNTSNTYPVAKLVSFTNNIIQKYDSESSAIDIGYYNNTQQWYNIIIVIKTSLSKDYKARVYSDDHSVDLSFSGNFGMSMHSAGDPFADNLGLAFLADRNGNAIDVLIDDVSIDLSSTDYNSFYVHHPIDVTQLNGKALLDLKVGTGIDVDSITADMITVADNTGNIIGVSDVMINSSNSLVAVLDTPLTADENYHITIDLYDDFGNKASAPQFTAQERLNRFSVEAMSFVNNRQITESLQSGNIEFNIAYNNSSDISQIFNVVAGFYENNVLKKIKLIKDISIESETGLIVSDFIDCTTDGDIADCNLRVFTIEALTTLKPILSTWEFNTEGLCENNTSNLLVASKYLPVTEPLEESFVFSNMGITIDSSSTFLGYQRGINRDLAFYGWKATSATAWAGDYTNLIALSDIDGDGLDDAILLDESNSLWWGKNTSNASFEDAQVLNIPPVPDDAKVTVGDFSGDGYADFAYINGGNISVYNNRGDVYNSLSKVSNELLSSFDAVEIKAGDFDGNGFYDLIAFNGNGEYLILYGDKEQRYTSCYKGILSFAGTAVKDYGLITVADFNTDNRCDLALYNSSVYSGGVLFLMGKGDSTFGINEAELSEKWATALYGKISWDGINPNIFVAGSLTDRYQHPDFAVVNNNELLVRKQTTVHIPYDYSMHLIKEGEKYRLYSGGRWMTVDDTGAAISGHDGDHVLLSESVDGGYSWTRYYKPMFYNGAETGNSGEWWASNVLEPEVIKVDGTYYMFCQVQVNPGVAVPDGDVATAQCDRIVLATSDDGYNWTYEASTTGSVIKNIAADVINSISLHHQEVMYVANDAEGKPWWLYVNHYIDGKAKGFFRIRSDNPRYFDYNDREKVSGLSQLGNQMGYIDDAPGGRAFIRITFSGGSPYFQMSRNGLSWYSPSGGMLAGVGQVSESAPNNANCYFLGIATENGTGRILPEVDGSYKIVYAASTSNSATSPSIFKSEGGIGIAFLKFE